MLAPNLLETGIYSVSEVAALVEAPEGTVRTWIDGRPNRQAAVIDNQLGKVAGKTAISFTNLMELRFVARFALAGIHLREIRAILDEMRHTMNHPHPLASKVVFRTDGKRILAETIRKNGHDILDLKSRNFEFPEMVADALKEDIVFDPQGEATAWFPRKKIAPHVVVNPNFSFGRPTLKESHIPTDTLAAAVKAERSAKTVAILFDVPERQVREAVAFQQNLRKAA